MKNDLLSKIDNRQIKVGVIGLGCGASSCC